MIRKRILALAVAAVMTLPAAAVAVDSSAAGVSQLTQSSGAAVATSRQTAQFTLSRPVTLSEVAAEFGKLEIDRVELIDS